MHLTGNNVYRHKDPEVECMISIATGARLVYE